MPVDPTKTILTRREAETLGHEDLVERVTFDIVALLKSMGDREQARGYRERPISEYQRAIPMLREGGAVGLLRRNLACPPQGDRTEEGRHRREALERHTIDVVAGMVGRLDRGTLVGLAPTPRGAMEHYTMAILVRCYVAMSGLAVRGDYSWMADLHRHLPLLDKSKFRQAFNNYLDGYYDEGKLERKMVWHLKPVARRMTDEQLAWHTERAVEVINSHRRKLDLHSEG